MNIKITTILNNLKELTLLETNDLIKEIEKIFKIDTSSISSTILNTGNSEHVNSELISKNSEKEKTTYTITLLEVPADKKISILKVIRTITGFGLKESKEIVDNIPKIVKEGISKEESDIFQKDLETAGAKVSIK